MFHYEKQQFLHCLDHLVGSFLVWVTAYVVSPYIVKHTYFVRAYSKEIFSISLDFHSRCKNTICFKVYFID